VKAHIDGVLIGIEVSVNECVLAAAVAEHMLGYIDVGNAVKVGGCRMSK
jgi:hypothetical protein